MLGTTVSAIIKVTTKVDICLYVNKMVLTTTMAEYKLELAHSIPHTITVTRTIGLVVLNPAKVRLLLRQWSFWLNPTVFLYVALLATVITHYLTSSRMLR